MTITVKKVDLWNAIVDNKPGALANVLEPLAELGTDLEVVMGTAIPGARRKASVGIFPVKGRRARAAAQAAGMVPAASMPSLLVVGDNRAGLGREMSRALAAAGIDIGLAIALVVGDKFSALFGFAEQADATRAAALLKKLGAQKSSRTKKAGLAALNASGPKARSPGERG